MTHQRGFSLIEALIALVVLSIGLVGVAAMQLKALQSANAGYQRSVVSIAAVDAQERFWAQLAMLDPGQTCENIDTAMVEDEWKEHWFHNPNTTPLRGASSDQSTIVNSGSSAGCSIRLNVALSDDDNDQFDYTFRLPRIETSP